MEELSLGSKNNFNLSDDESDSFPQLFSHLFLEKTPHFNCSLLRKSSNECSLFNTDFNFQSPLISERESNSYSEEDQNESCFEMQNKLQEYKEKKMEISKQDSSSISFSIPLIESEKENQKDNSVGIEIMDDKVIITDTINPNEKINAIEKSILVREKEEKEDKVLALIGKKRSHNDSPLEKNEGTKIKEKREKATISKTQRPKKKYPYKCEHPGCDKTFRTFKLKLNRHDLSNKICKADTITVLNLINDTISILKNIKKKRKNEKKFINKLLNIYLPNVPHKDYVNTILNLNY